jgi:PiT family inorganic phosphate transporter
LEVLDFQKNIGKLKEIKSPSWVVWTTYAASVLDIKKVDWTNVESIITKTDFQKNIDSISNMIDYAPWWIIFLVSFSLWLWTMIWRKRIVTTIWEKIWKTKMNYSQATTASLMTAMTISLATRFHLPVSTTHILSSSVAWSMYASRDTWGWLQWDTIKHILLAWLFTLPVTIILSWTIFLTLWFIFIR